MKKNVLGLLAVVAAVSLSAFTVKSKAATTDLYYWFDQTNGEFVGSTSSPSVNPLECYGEGDDCIKGYLRSSQPVQEPSGNVQVERSFNQ